VLECALRGTFDCARIGNEYFTRGGRAPDGCMCDLRSAQVRAEHLPASARRLGEIRSRLDDSIQVRKSGSCRREVRIIADETLHDSPRPRLHTDARKAEHRVK
jgi:hypothetical protein